MVGNSGTIIVWVWLGLQRTENVESNLPYVMMRYAIYKKTTNSNSLIFIPSEIYFTVSSFKTVYQDSMT